METSESNNEQSQLMAQETDLDDEIDLAPDSQRNANIWTTKAKSRLID